MKMFTCCYTAEVIDARSPRPANNKTIDAYSVDIVPSADKDDDELTANSTDVDSVDKSVPPERTDDATVNSTDGESVPNENADRFDPSETDGAVVVSARGDGEDATVSSTRNDGESTSVKGAAETAEDHYCDSPVCPLCLVNRLITGPLATGVCVPSTTEFDPADADATVLHPSPTAVVRSVDDAQERATGGGPDGNDGTGGPSERVDGSDTENADSTHEYCGSPRCLVCLANRKATELLEATGCHN